MRLPHGRPGRPPGELQLRLVATRYNSCGDRHCPTCQAPHRARWLAGRVERLLPVGHFQVVFTLPAELRPWARTAPRVTYNALFRAAADTLSELADSRLREGRTSAHFDRPGK